MAEELKVNLNTYKVQIQQVEAALTTDAENEELLKLKKDLQEVIDLTEDLISSQQAGGATEAAAAASTSSAPAEEREFNWGYEPPQTSSSTQWAVGDRCSAPWSEDSQYYRATVDEVLQDGTCTVTFDKYNHTEVVQISQLRSVEAGKKLAEGEAGGQGANKPQTKKDRMAAEREYKKKKQQKKAQRQKQLEDEREGEKNKWLDFNAKVYQKTAKGRVKKSIFATPDSNGGRVGVGTCGVSGKPMTQFTHRDKWKK